MPLVLSLVFRSISERLPDLLAMVSFSLNHFDVNTSNPCHVSTLLMMHNEHTVLVSSFVHRQLSLNLKLGQTLWYGTSGSSFIPVFPTSNYLFHPFLCREEVDFGFIFSFFFSFCFLLLIGCRGFLLSLVLLVSN